MLTEYLVRKYHVHLVSDVVQDTCIGDEDINSLGQMISSQL